MPRSFLIVDGYAAPAREQLISAGCTLAGELYERMLRRYVPDAACDIAHPADSADFLGGRSLAEYEALLWTGSSLNIYDGTPSVDRQIELARTAFDAGVPSFGSCWALHIAVTAAGGKCRLNPNGREFGVSRDIELTAAGRAHTMFAGRSANFDGYTSHFDDVETLPAGSVPLATNAATEVQAAIIAKNGVEFWAVQYHPEYDLREVAALARFRSRGLIDEGRFADETELRNFYARYETLHDRPDDADLARELNIGTDLLDVDARCAEFRAWLGRAGNESP